MKSPRHGVIFDLKLSLLAGGFLFVGANMLFEAAHAGRVMPEVMVSNVAVGGLTRAEAAQQLEAESAEYELNFTLGDNISKKIKPKEVGVTIDPWATVDRAMLERRFNPIAIIGAAQEPSPLGANLKIDSAKLDSYIAQIAQANISDPTDATIEITNGEPKIIPEKAGLGMDSKYISRMVIAAVAARKTTITLEPHPIEPDIKSVDLAKNVTEAKELMLNKVSMTYEGLVFAPTTAEVGSWLSFPKIGPGSRQTVVDEVKVAKYVASVASRVDVAPVDKLVEVINGEQRSEEGGTDGKAIDRASVTKAIVLAVSSKKPLTLALETRPVLFRTKYHRTISLDYGRYVEVNLTTQHLWAYQDHKLVFDTPITSGAAGAGFPTVQGLFSIYSKEQNRYLNGRPLGYNYNVYVRYWMPFYADYGLHDADWRSEFGGPDYYYNGSHGCVNMPVPSAAWLYGWADIGTPVWVHS